MNANTDRSPQTAVNADQAELAKFNSLAQRWWDPAGAFRPLHDMNPIRLSYIERAFALRGKRVLDVGCGGGILSESMARAGAIVTAIDLAGEALDVAKLHALESAVSIDYRLVAAEQLAGDMPGAFDLVTCMEMLEHVPDPMATLAALKKLCSPTGRIIVSTLNRNPKAFLLAIVGAEYLMRLLPRGTHDYSKFIKPSELARWGRGCGLALRDVTGIRYHPSSRSFSLSSDADVNFLAQFTPQEHG